MISRLQKQIEFIREIDKLKTVLRSNRIMDKSRLENSAEHSWSVAIMAHLLAEHSDDEINVDRVCKMLLLHDIIEVDAGDTFRYDEVNVITQIDREIKAADRIFALLPDDQKVEFRQLWDEFEALNTPDARFAKALDHLACVLHNSANDGGSWTEHGITESKVKEKNRPIPVASTMLGEFAMRLISEVADKGFIAKAPNK